MAYLRIEKIDGRVKEFELQTNAVVLGRSTEADVVIADAQASRRHAVVQRQPDGGWVLRDLGSQNKTFINRQAISTHVLRSGDVFMIGSTRIHFLETTSPQADKSNFQPKAGISGRTMAPAKSPVCPACKATMGESAILCVKCGYNFKTGKKLQTQAPPFTPAKETTGHTKPAVSETDEGPRLCPCCEQALPSKTKICVTCGIDVRTGRAIQTVRDQDLNRIYTVAENTISWLSWIVWSGIWPITSEALGLRKPWATRGIAVATMLISVWFMIVYVYNPHPKSSAINLMHWTGSAEVYQRRIEALRQRIDAVVRSRAAPFRQALKDAGVNDKTINEQVAEYEKKIREQIEIKELPRGQFHAYQLITAAFLHAGILHLAGNLVFFLVLGSRVNALIGNILTLALYPVLAIAASLVDMAAMAHEPLHPSLGASGAIMGLAGMYLVLMPFPKIHMAVWLRVFRLYVRLFAIRGFWVVLFFIGFDVFYTAIGLKDNVGHWAHLGGFLAGVALAILLLCSRVVNARGGDLISVILGRRAWALIGKPNRRPPATFLA
jgi:membrane associated rhomboid family serine protease/pSer/pThr/pTyr-binding forkhead associated (FHA) protein